MKMKFCPNSYIIVSTVGPHPLPLPVGTKNKLQGSYKLLLFFDQSNYSFFVLPVTNLMFIII